VSDYGLLYGRIAGFFVGLPLVQLNCHWRGNWPELVHSELRQDRLNVAVLMDVNCAMLPIVFNVHADLEGDPPAILHPEPLLHQILHLPNQACVSNDEEIIDVQNDCRNDAFIHIMEHEPTSVGT
jgi:hypothetical protein